MVKLCILSEEVRMSGEIGITAKFQIITKAKLDSIRSGSFISTWLMSIKPHKIIEWLFGEKELIKVLQVIVSAMAQRKKMKFMISFLSLMVQDWFYRIEGYAYDKESFKFSRFFQNYVATVWTMFIEHSSGF